MTGVVKGSICGVAAAITYGCNPLALFLYEIGVNVNSVLFYRFSIAAVILGLWLLIKGTPLRINMRQGAIVAGLGILFAISSLSLFFSFKFMDVGIASTLLFVYPVMVAVIMTAFFHERLTATIVLAIISALAGVGLLCQGGEGSTINATGIGLVMLSSLAYAVYMVAVQKLRIDMPTEKLTFYVLIVCAAIILLHSSIMPGSAVMILNSLTAWGWALFLAIVPTVMSIDLANVALREIGSTPTAIMGALEPLTAVLIGAAVFGEPITMRLAIGIVLILGSVLLVIAGKSVKKPKFIQHRYTIHHE